MSGEASTLRLGNEFRRYCLALHRTAMMLSLASGGSATLSVTGRCRDGTVMKTPWNHPPSGRCSILLTSKYKTAAIVG